MIASLLPVVTDITYRVTAPDFVGYFIVSMDDEVIYADALLYELKGHTSPWAYALCSARNWTVEKAE